MARLSNEERLNRVVQKAVAGFAPPEGLTVSQWAESRRRLSAEASAEPGRWRNSRTPYLVEVMDAFSDPAVRHVVMVAASQVGKTEAILNCIGYVIDQDPGSILFVHPTTIDAKEFSKLRIAPMIRDTPALRRKVADAKSRDSGNTVLQKNYPGGILTLCGSNEAHALASKPIRYVFGDERDRWGYSAGDEGDPWSLAMARQTTFYNAKSVEVSTPTVKGASNIAAAYAGGTMERWQSRCPHCGGYHEIKFADIRFEHEASTVEKAKHYTVGRVWYVCPSCGGVSDEREMKRAPAHWVAENPAARSCRSFWLNAFVSSWASWESIILKFLQATGDSRKLQTVYNTAFGELWENREDVQDDDSILARREDYGTNADGTRVELPEGVLVLTAGVDTQDNRFEYEIVGHGLFGETWGIEYGVVMGRPDDPATWQKLDELVFKRRLKFAGGASLGVSAAFVDEGGHFTQQVRQRCADRIALQVFCIKGMSGQGKPYTQPPKKMAIMSSDQRTAGSCWQYQLGVDAGKQLIMDSLRVQEPGPKYCHFPKRDDYGATYFRGLLSERLVYNAKSKSGSPWHWEKLPGHERNEALDCRNYAMAAFASLAKDMDAIAQRVRELKQAAQDGREAPAGVSIPPRRKDARTGARNAPQRKRRYYDDW